MLHVSVGRTRRTYYNDSADLVIDRLVSIDFTDYTVQWRLELFIPMKQLS